MSKSLLNKILNRGVVQVYPSVAKLEKALQKPKGLTFYFGIDPTAPFVHLGHIIPARKLEQLRQLGCKVVLLIGNFTATIGDPTDKKAARKALSLKQVENNAKNYVKQLEPVLGIKDKKNPVVVKRNNDWWGKMVLGKFMEIAQTVTTQRLLERDMFQERIKESRPIFVHELLYPLIHGYDGVAMKVDGEVGGNDQTFNMLMGRDLSGAFLKKEKFVITTKLLVDPTGKKMGKTEGNVVRLDLPPTEMYGRIMSWPDGVIADGFELLTDVDLSEVQNMQKQLNPRDFKARLALEVTTIFHGQKKAQEAESAFNRVFRAKETPEDIKEIKLKTKKLTAVDLLVETKLASSRSEARRIIEQGGMKINGKVVLDSVSEIDVAKGGIVQRGKRHFVRLA
jgi:tyrosyl-tRNA synthetase